MYTRVKQGIEQQAVYEQYSQRVHIRYNSNQLREIEDNIKPQKQYKRLTHSTIINVRRLQLNMRRSRGQPKAMIWKRTQSRVKTNDLEENTEQSQDCSKFQNLTEIKIDKTIDIKKHNRKPFNLNKQMFNHLKTKVKKFMIISLNQDVI